LTAAVVVVVVLAAVMIDSWKKEGSLGAVEEVVVVARVCATLAWPDCSLHPAAATTILLLLVAGRPA